MIRCYVVGAEGSDFTYNSHKYVIDSDRWSPKPWGMYEPRDAKEEAVYFETCRDIAQHALLKLGLDPEAYQEESDEVEKTESEPAPAIATEPEPAAEPEPEPEPEAKPRKVAKKK